MKILNLYAGIGGNRKLWEGHEVTAVEHEPYIAEAYSQMFPQDKVIIADAHQYLLGHYKDFDFIWSSPPCPTHSKMNNALKGWGIIRYPDMSLYQEIILLKHFFRGKWVVENVEPYYKPLINPSAVLDRHFYWANFSIPFVGTGRQGNVTKNTKEENAEILNIQLPEGTKNQRKLLRNAVDPKLGLHILRAAEKEIKQEEMSFPEALTSAEGVGVPEGSLPNQGKQELLGDTE